MKISVKNKFLLLAIILLVGAGFSWQDQIKDVFLSQKESLLPAATISLPNGSLLDEPITLPEETEEQKQEEESVITQENDQINDNEVVYTPEDELSELSKKEIQEQIEEITAKIEVLTKKTSESKEKPTEKDRELKLVEIQDKINEISQQIESISEQIVQLAEASTNQSLSGEASDQVAQI